MSAFDESENFGRKKKIIIEPIFSEISVQNDLNPKVTQTRVVPTIPSVESKTPNQDINKKERREPISSLGISISAIAQEKNKPAEVVDRTGGNLLLSETFTPIELLNEWKSYAESLVEEHHLKNTMLNCLPDLQNRDTFEVIVNNPVQEQRLLDNALSILSVLREKLRNGHIQMKVRVTIDNEKKLGFTSLEKYNLMVEQNDSLKKLKDEFGLELL